MYEAIGFLNHLMRGEDNLGWIVHDQINTQTNLYIHCDIRIADRD